MAKSKSKRSKPAISADPINEPDIVEASVLDDDQHLRAMDGQNVEGWAEDDIRTYNELLMERAKLEKERNELEKKTSRHHTQRALLNENAAHLDSFFKQQTGGEFLYTGNSACCLHPQNGSTNRGGEPRCHHEICLRAKTKGISWLEMDTIKYYEVRMSTEKSERMKNALRKQRDVELVRVKKEEDEEHASRARKSAFTEKARERDAQRGSLGAAGKSDDASYDIGLDGAATDSTLDPKNSAILQAAKENEQYVRKIRGDLDKIRRDVNAGKIKPSDARVKLEKTHAEMAEAERKNDSFKQLLQGNDAPGTSQQTASSFDFSRTLMKSLTSASGGTDAFTQAMSVMKGFFSASDPGDVQNAISDLRSVLEISGPMSPTLQKSFKALEDMVGNGKQRAFNVDFKTSNGDSFNCTSVADVMLNLRSKMQSNTTAPALSNPELKLDEEMVKANQECIKVEEAAKKEMWKEGKRLSKDDMESLTAALRRIKQKAIVKSPIPPLSDIVLDGTIDEVLEVHVARDLVQKVKEGLTESQIAGKMTSMIIARAGNKPERYMEAFTGFEAALNTALAGESIASVDNALAKVEVAMKNFVQKHEEKKLADNQGATRGNVLPTGSNSSTINAQPQQAQTQPDPEASKDWEDLRLLIAAAEQQPHQIDGKVLHESILKHFSKYLHKGIWHIFRLYAQVQKTYRFQFDPWMTEKAKNSTARAYKLSAEDVGLLPCLVEFYDTGHCPAITTVLIAQQLTTLARREPKKAATNIRVLEGVITGVPLPMNKQWFGVFKELASTLLAFRAAVQISAATVVSFGDAAIMAADAMAMISTFVLLVGDSDHARTNLRICQAFIIKSFVNPKSEADRNIQSILASFDNFSKVPMYRCTIKGPCKDHMQDLSEFGSHALVPQPLKVGATKDTGNIKGQPRTTTSNTPGTTRLGVRQDAVSRLTQSARAGGVITTIIPRRPPRPDTGKAQLEERDIRMADNFRELATISPDVAQKALQIAEIQLRAYEVGKLEPPRDILNAVKDLKAAVYGPEYDEYDDEFQDDDESYQSEDESLCSCEACQEEQDAVAVSRFIEHIDEDVPVAEPDGDDRTVAEYRVKQIVDGAGNDDYFTCVANNIKADALSERQIGFEGLKVFDRFEKFFLSVGPMPNPLKSAIERAKTETLKELAGRFNASVDRAQARLKDDVRPQKTQEACVRAINDLLRQQGLPPPVTAEDLTKLALKERNTFLAYGALLDEELKSRGITISDYECYLIDVESMLIRSGRIREDVAAIAKWTPMVALAELARDFWSRHPPTSPQQHDEANMPPLTKQDDRVTIGHVPVGTPVIRNGNGHLEVPTASAVEDDVLRQRDGDDRSVNEYSDNNSSFTSPGEVRKPAITEDGMSERERTIKRGLSGLRDKVQQIQVTTDTLPANEHKTRFRNVAKEFERMTKGHFEMAAIVAEANGHTLLGNWVRAQLYGQ